MCVCVCVCVCTSLDQCENSYIYLLYCCLLYLPFQSIMRITVLCYHLESGLDY